MVRQNLWEQDVFKLNDYSPECTQTPNEDVRALVVLKLNGGGRT